MACAQVARLVLGWQGFNINDCSGTHYCSGSVGGRHGPCSGACLARGLQNRVRRCLMPVSATSYCSLRNLYRVSATDNGVFVVAGAALLVLGGTKHGLAMIGVQMVHTRSEISTCLALIWHFFALEKCTQPTFPGFFTLVCAYCLRRLRHKHAAQRQFCSDVWPLLHRCAHHSTLPTDGNVKLPDLCVHI